MKIHDVNVIDKSYLKITDFENILNVYQDKNGNYFYNLNSTLYLNIDDNVLKTYKCQSDLQWPLISYKIYGTTRLAWFLMKINKVQPKDVFKLKHAGETVKFLDKEQMSSLIATLNNFDK